MTVIHFFVKPVPEITTFSVFLFAFRRNRGGMGRASSRTDGRGKIFGPKTEEGTEYWRRLHDEELND
jgi:hypothetical protein